MAETAQGLSLFEDYKQRQPDLGFGFGRGMLTEEGASIFAAHIRAERTRHLSRVLGGLAYSRSEKPLDDPVIVLETDASAEDVQEDWIMRGAAGGVIDHLVAIDATTLDAVTDREVDGVVMHEARLITGTYVSVQLGDIARVVLSPTPLAEIK